MPLDPPIAALLQQMEANGAAGGLMAAGDIVAARTLMGQMLGGLAMAEAPTGVADPTSTEIPSDAGPIPALVYRPASEGPHATLVFLHGGGFALGDAASYDGQVRAIVAGLDAVVVSVDYRLAPEHPFPAAVEDAIAATNWAGEHLAELGGREDRLAVGGDSAGGNLSAVVAQARRDAGLPLAGQLLIYPVTDPATDFPSLTENGEGYFLTKADMTWFEQAYAGEQDIAAGLADVRASPATGDLQGLAPAVVTTAGFDPLRDDGDAYARALEAAGVTVRHLENPSLIHGWLAMAPLSPAAREARDAALTAFKDLLA
ncbi:alpha/beta hydrolase [Patulibacter sp.]|uniref:alpha/beta hydrolase n=1 Tax=Patulibacter sp. TaxID=1912859 RepID=UPI0027281C8D|nr:alpha/beta hydrolase [Patulibacter sp.]MDO9409164.1 alpha/beta hydrolase [Patulibacter sp.]